MLFIFAGIWCKWVIKKSSSWDNQSVSCFKYECNNKTGSLSTVDTCVSNECYDGKCDNNSCDYEPNSQYSDLIQQQNECYEVVCANTSGWVLQKSYEAIEWENQTDECLVFQCLSGTGLVAWSNCNSTGDVSLVCVDHKCVDKKTLGDIVPVEIELEPGKVIPGFQQ